VVTVHGTVGVVCGKCGDSGLLYQSVTWWVEAFCQNQDCAGRDQHPGWLSSQTNRFILTESLPEVERCWATCRLIFNCLENQ